MLEFIRAKAECGCGSIALAVAAILPGMSDAFQAHVAPGGWQFPAPGEHSLLQSALAAGVLLPNSCRNGTCRACLCRLDAGRIRYRIHWPGVSREEQAEGLILPCVAHPLSDVVLRVPHARRAG